MDLLVRSFVFHSSLITMKSDNSMVAHDDLLFVKNSVFFILATLIAQLLFFIHIG